MYEIAVPKLNSNDVSYVITEWLFGDGDHVPAGAEVVVVETSKAAEELTVDGGGVLHRTVKASAECRPGDVVGRLFADEGERQRFLEGQPVAAQGDRPSGPLLTEPARALAERLGLTADELRRLGQGPVTRADIEALAVARQDANGWHTPSRRQRMIAEVVALSHRTIPAAFAVAEVEVDTALAQLNEFAGREHVNVGLPELVVCCIARLHDRFPLCFARLGDDGRAELSSAPRIGVTIDVGTGLFVPVLSEVGTLRRIAEGMTEHRMKALRSEFREADLAGANFSVSLPSDDIVLAQPLVLPPQVCMLALGATQTGVRLGEQGEVTARRYVQIGLAYDHRLINGRDAAEFLGALKKTMQEAESLRSVLR